MACCSSADPISYPSTLCTTKNPSGNKSSFRVKKSPASSLLSAGKTLPPGHLLCYLGGYLRLTNESPNELCKSVERKWGISNCVVWIVESDEMFEHHQQGYKDAMYNGLVEIYALIPLAVNIWIGEVLVIKIVFFVDA